MPKVIQDQTKLNYLFNKLEIFKLKPSVGNHIQFYRRVTSAGLAASTLFILLTLLILTPLDLSGEKGLAASGDTSTTSLTLATSGSAELDLLVTSDSGTFASSGTPLTFNVSTNNYTGYTVSIRAKSGTELTNTAVDRNNNTVNNTFTSISGSGITSDTFDTSTYNGMWGIKPNYYDSNANTDKFYPSPTTSGIVLNRTDCANNTTSSDNALCKEASNTYNISIAARATYSQTAGTYSNTYILNVIGNYPAYTVTYDANGGTGAPDTQSATSIANSSVDVTLSSAQPTRTGYTFAGWCSVDNSANSSTCNGDTYKPSDPYTLDTINSNTVKLYAIWTINQYDCIKRYRTQTATGGWSDYTTESTTKVNYNETCTYTKTLTNYKPSASGTNNSQATTSGTVTTSGVTLNLSFYRNTYTLTVNRNSTYISSASATTSAVHGTNYYRWGQSVSISATASSGNKFTSWSQTAGTASSFGNTTSASTTFTMPKSNATVYANGSTNKIYMQDLTLANCQQNVGTNGNSANIGDNITVYDRRDGSDYTVRYINGLCWMTQNLRITGTISATDSNFTRVSSYNVSANDISDSSNSSSGGPCYGDVRGVSNGYDNACSKDSGSKTTGVWYNYAATTAGQITGIWNSTAVTQDICPANWHLPTGPNTTSGTEINKLVGNTTSGWQSPTASFTAFGAVTGGFYDNGLFSGVGIGAWWSATTVEFSDSNRYDLGYGYNNGQFRGDDYGIRAYGFFVRCVRSS